MKIHMMGPIEQNFTFHIICWRLSYKDHSLHLVTGGYLPVITDVRSYRLERGGNFFSQEVTKNRENETVKPEKLLPRQIHISSRAK
jgi:hypothetical protein